MKIQDWIIHPYKIPMLNGEMRSGVVIEIRGKNCQSGWGEIAPLPNWSHETLEQALDQLFRYKQLTFEMDWTRASLIEAIQKLKLFPSVGFGVESALHALVDPLPVFSIPISAFFSGAPTEILKQAKHRKREGFDTAKLKVSHLSIEEAQSLILQLKDDFHLRIDVNRAWKTDQSLAFFSQFDRNAFDYVEEPFQNPQDLHLFTHPLAVDESFPSNLSFKDLEKLPMLKALIYKPTLHGGLSGCLPLHQWTSKHGIQLVLSSCYESEVGLKCIANLAQRLGLKSPLGIGTAHFFKRDGFNCC